MVSNSKNFRLDDWINHLQSNGRLAFSLNNLRKEANTLSEEAIKLALNRLSGKDKILSIHKGYYLIIPPIYQSKGVLPPIYFIDEMMKNLNRPYYVGLLNAAALHGAGHQQPQTFCAVSNFPVLRPTIKKGIRINYLTIKEIPIHYVEGVSDTFWVNAPRFFSNYLYYSTLYQIILLFISYYRLPSNIIPVKIISSNTCTK
jgi:hypothetical protein